MVLKRINVEKKYVIFENPDMKDFTDFFPFNISLNATNVFRYEEIVEWCFKNCTDIWSDYMYYDHMIHFFFKEKNDAIRFKLLFHGK